MKKWIILTAVVLMGLIMGLQYFSKRHKADQVVPGAAQQPGEPAGVSLPADAGNIPAYPAGDSTNFGVLSSLGAERACEGGSINEIVESKGKKWGPGATSKENIGIKGSEIEKVEAALGDYFTCAALVTKDLNLCSYGPANKRASGPTIKMPCDSVLKEMLFAYYMAGKYTDSNICALMVTTADSELKGLTPGEFCPVAAKGMENICAGLPSINKKDCLSIFPARESDCGGDKDCVTEYNLYQAVKKGDPAKCPSAYRTACDLFFTKSQSPCSDFALKASKLYCSYQEKSKENSLEKMKEKREAEQRTEQERVAREKTIEEINKQIKQVGKTK